MERPDRKRRRRHAFTPEEDDRLRELVAKYGDGDWSLITKKMPKRDLRQCRERWINYLAPEAINGPWTPAEDLLLTDKVTELGRQWKVIAPFFPGRTDINVRNRWCHLQKHIRPQNSLNAETVERILSSLQNPQNGTSFHFPSLGATYF
jgi:hypothetical protein